MGGKDTLTCPLCGSTFQYKPHYYHEGKWVKSLGTTVCRTCYDGNWDGWNPQVEEKVIELIEEQGFIVPERNEKGWIPRDFNPEQAE